jgi:carboxyl-terminal processing protease
VSIKPANYVPAGDLKELVAPLQKRHEARIAKDKEFQDLREDIAEVMKLRKENAISLNEAVRRKERDTQDARAKLREARLAAAKGASTSRSRRPAARKHAARCPSRPSPVKAVVAARNSADARRRPAG